MAPWSPETVPGIVVEHLVYILHHTETRVPLGMYAIQQVTPFYHNTRLSCLTTWLNLTEWQPTARARGDTILTLTFFGGGSSPPVGQDLPIHEVSRSHTTTQQSVGLLQTSDQLVAETSTQQHMILTTDRHPCPRWDSNPQPQQASGRRPTP